MVTVLLQASYLGSKCLLTQRTFEKTALLGGFFVYRARDYDGSERISRRTLIYITKIADLHPDVSNTFMSNMRTTYEKLYGYSSTIPFRSLTTRESLLWRKYKSDIVVEKSRPLSS
ncbi:hypothetical protein D3W76_25590 [Salmonella enterica]|nr:hypothetical protein [Escherichia coli]EBO8175170.1 hypothetical protein [Salmonella enterica]